MFRIILFFYVIDVDVRQLKPPNIRVEFSSFPRRFISVFRAFQLSPRAGLFVSSALVSSSPAQLYSSLLHNRHRYHELIIHREDASGNIGPVARN